MTKKEIKEKVKYLETNGLLCPNVSKLRGNASEEMFFEAYSKDIQELRNKASNILKVLSIANPTNPPKKREILECTEAIGWEPRFFNYPYHVTLTSVVKKWLNYFEVKTSVKPNEIIVSNGNMKLYLEESIEYDKTNSTFQNTNVIFKYCTKNIIKIHNTEYEEYSLGIIGVL